MRKDDGGPAFPWEYRARDSTGEERVQASGTGMSLRDWFAGQALANEYAQDNENPDRVAEWAYSVADAMLAARTTTE